VETDQEEGIPGFGPRPLRLVRAGAYSLPSLACEAVVNQDATQAVAEPNRQGAVRQDAEQAAEPSRRASRRQTEPTSGLSGKLPRQPPPN
jgi:hypothetical protein